MNPYATAVTISGAAVFGVVLALLGSVKLTLARQFDLSGRRLAGLLATLNLALIPMTLLAGYLADAWQPRVVLLLGSCVTSLALFAMSRAPHYRGAVSAVMLAGLGAAFVSAASVKLMAVAFYQANPARGLSLGYVFIACGALLTPALAAVLIHRLDFRRGVTILAFLCLLPAFLCVLPPFGEPVNQLVKPTTTFNLFDGEHLWKLALAAAIFFCYAPLEAAISTYLTERGYGERGATWMLSGFWAMLLLSRILLAVVHFGEAWNPWLIGVLALLTVVALGNLAGSAEKWAPRTGLLVLGFLLGPIFPALLGVVAHFARDELGLAYGVVFAAGSIGGLILAPVVAPRASKEGMAMFRAPILLSLAMTVAALVFGLTVGTGK
jgi:fucose permease